MAVRAKRGPRKPRTWFGRWLQNLRISRKLAVVITVHLLHATVLLALTSYGIKAVDASRAWVDGEGFWSKAQKEGVVQLLAYADSGDDANYDAYLRNITITLGDRKARLELEKDSPDVAVAKAGFIQARNHPDDVGNMVWLFQTFRHEAHIDHAIAVWTQAEDTGIEPLRALAEELRAERTAAVPDTGRINATVGRILGINAYLDGLEHEFSRTLGDGARFITLVVVYGTFALTLVFVGSALLISAAVARHITSSLGQVKEGAERMAAGEVGVQIAVQGRDDVAGVAQAFNAMSQQLAKAMREREEHASALVATVEAATDGILVVDGTGRIVQFNKNFIAMWRIPDEVLAARSDERALAFVLEQLVDPDAFLAKVKALYGDPDAESFDVLHFKDGRVFERYSRPQRIEGRNVGRVWSFRDITGRLAIENERLAARERVRELNHLKEVNRFKTEFINTAAHELRTPMTPLRLQMHLLMTSHQGPVDGAQMKALSIMNRNLERLGVLVEDMLIVARSQAGRLQLEPESIDLRGLFVEAAQSFEAAAKERGIEMLVAHKGPIPVVADPKKVMQVLMNLLNNAFKFTPRGGRVEIAAQEEGSNVRVRIIDSGIGIASADLGRLFVPFVQVHDTPVLSTQPGSGLGLYISRQLIEMHGGLVGAESLGRGKGSTFWFLLPKVAQVQPPAASGELPDGLARFNNDG